MTTLRYLYRGIARAAFAVTDGGLRPRSTGAFAYVFHAGEVVNRTTGRILTVNDGAVAGESDVNAVLRHQIDQHAGFPTAGVSTTPFYDRAEHYATHGHSGQPGYVLKIDCELLSHYGVRTYRVRGVVPAPSIPEDDEVILVAEDGGSLPAAIVVQRTEV